MRDSTKFPGLDEVEQLKKTLFKPRSGSRLSGFSKALSVAFDRLGFTKEFVDEKCLLLSERSETCDQIELNASQVDKVVKDVIWGMIDLDRTTVELLDTPIVQRLRYIRQNGFTYLVYPGASHSRLEHSLGVTAVVSRYIESINASANHPTRLAHDLKKLSIDPMLALDLKHAALLHDIGHFPYSHVVERIFQAEKSFLIGNAPVREFEIPFMEAFRDQDSDLSEKLSIAIVLSPRFQQFYTALRKDPCAYLRVACLISGAPLEVNLSGYSQLISGAVDSDKVDYLLRDAAMCNVPVAIDQTRLFLNSALIECQGETVRKLRSKKVLGIRIDLDRPAATLVLNSSGVDTIEEVAFARATLYERVYRHPVTRNAERMMSVAIGNAAAQGKPSEGWKECLNAYTSTDDTFMNRLERSRVVSARALVARLRQRRLPKRSFAFSPDFYSPVVPYADIFFPNKSPSSISGLTDELVSKDPFHSIVSSLKEKSEIFSSNESRAALERKIEDQAAIIGRTLRKSISDHLKAAIPTGRPQVFFVPLPDHSAKPMTCAVMTHDGELESSDDYSRGPQLLSAKELGRSVGFVTCDMEWSEIVFLASQRVLYDFFDGDGALSTMDLRIPEPLGSEGSDPSAQPTILRLSSLKRFYIAEHLAARRCRLDRSKLLKYRKVLSKAGYYDKRPRLAEGERSTSDIEDLSKKFADFSGQHDWSVTSHTVRQFANQFPPGLRDEVKKLLKSFTMLDRLTVAKLLDVAIRKLVKKIRATNDSRTIHLVPLSGTSARVVMELTKQEAINGLLKELALKDHKSIHEVLGRAKPEDAIILIDDNIGSGVQFSAQILAWLGLQEKSSDRSIVAEAGIERTHLNPNQLQLMSKVDIYLATCVGREESQVCVLEYLSFADKKVKFSGLEYGRSLTDRSATISAPLRAYLKRVGAELIRWSRDLKEVNAECRANALGYDNAEGRTVTLWNVPTSTYTAFWCPGMIDGEPWCPLFIRRGYSEKLIIA